MLPGCPPWGRANNAKGRRREAKRPPRVVKGVQKASNEGLSDPKRRPNGGLDGLGHPLGRPGAAWGDHRENELRGSVFPGQKRSRFGSPRGQKIINFRYEFRIESRPKGGQRVPKARPTLPLETIVAPFFDLWAREADPSKMLARANTKARSGGQRRDTPTP